MISDEDKNILRVRARALAQLDEQKSSAERLDLLVFRLGEQLFAIRGQHATEVFRFVEGNLVPLPGCKEQLAGVISLRGALLPVVRSRLLLLKNQDDSEDRNVIVVNTQDSDYGLLVDEVIGMRLLPVDELLVPTGGDAAPWVRGITADDVTVLHLLPLLTFENLGFQNSSLGSVG